jgi:iron complex outermembrane receptor protein
MSFSALAGVMALGVMAPGAPAFAADAAAPAADSAGASAKVDEVVVTGALRSQRLQEAPMAVSAVKPEEFINSGFKEPRELQFLSPSIQVSIQGANAIYIRGSGTNSQNGGTEQSVGMVIDGVLMGFVDDIGGDISDLDHIEVYRGPQGTQFAKNASAGVVSVMTKRPQIGALDGVVHASYGEHNDTSDDATINVPINDTMAARMSASFQHRDGVFPNLALHQYQGGREQKGVKFKYLWSPKDRVQIYLSADARLQFDKPNFPQAWAQCGTANQNFATFVSPNYAKLVAAAKNGNAAYLAAVLASDKMIGACNSGFLAGIAPSATSSQIAENDDAFRHTSAGGTSLEIDYPLGDFQLMSLTAYRFMSRRFYGPTGSGYYTNSYLQNWYNGGQVSEELRLISPAGKKLTWVNGLFLYDRDTVTKACGCGPAYGQAQIEYPNTLAGPGVFTASNGGQTKAHNVNKSYAVYTDGSFHFTDKLQLNAGFRVTYDDIYASIATVPVTGVYNSPSTIVGGVVLVPGVINGTFFNAGQTGTFVIPVAVNNSTTPAVVALPFRSLDETHTGYTYRIGPQYFFTPDIQLYATYAHGYKGPLIDTSINVLDAIKPEEVDMWETGLKTSWLQHRVTADVTFFHQLFKNYQVNVLNQQVIPNTFQLGNAGGMLSQGAEFELTARPLDDWLFNAGFTYNDSHYTDFVTSCWNSGEPIKQIASPPAPPAPNTCLTVAQKNPTTGAVTNVTSTNAAGTPLINSSRWTYRLSGTYTHVIDRWKLDAQASWFWRSQWLSAPMDPNIVNPGYGVVNFSGGVTTPDGNYRFGIFARNALNTFFLAGRQSNNGGWTNVLNPEAVRTVGVNFTGKF